MRPRLVLAAALVLGAGLTAPAFAAIATDSSGACGSLVQTPSHLVGVVSGGSFRRIYDSRMVAAYGYSGRPRLIVADAVVAALPTAALTAL